MNNIIKFINLLLNKLYNLIQKSIIMKKITSTSNELIKKIYKYSKSQSTQKKNSITLLDGLHLLEEVFKTKNQDRLLHVFCTEKSIKMPEIALFLKQNKINSILITQSIMNKISHTKTPQGILGVYNFPKNPKTLSKKAKTIILLDKISDPGNLGTIIRTGISMGADAFFCSAGCANVWSPKVLRASQGANFYTNIFIDFDLNNINKIFDGEIFGTFLDLNAQNIYKTTFPEKAGFCFGNEGSGINSLEFDTYGDKKIFIPMSKNFESLNVAISCAICLSERKRQLTQ